MRGAEKILVVEDSAALRRALGSALRARGAAVTLCAGVREAREALAPAAPDVVLLDVHLTDGSAFELLESVRPLRPRPVTIAMSGKASADEAFRLARLGVSAYLPKPLDLTTLDDTLDRALVAPPDLELHVRSAVGKVAVRDAERLVRSTMVDEAMARTGGNVRGAARLLDVSRELLQHIVRARR
jgi:two-component system, response regulator RegA